MGILMRLIAGSDAYNMIQDFMAWIYSGLI